MKRFLVATFTIIALIASYSLFSTSHRINTADAQGKSDQVDLPPPAQDAPGIIKHRVNPYGADNVTVGTTGSVSPPITYHGGQLINTPTAYIIWYGNWNQSNGTDTPAGQQIVRDFLSNLGNSNYYAINRSYSTNGYNITGGVNFVPGTYSSTNPNGCETTVTSTTKRITDSNVLSIVNSAITSGKLPYNQDGVYFVLTSSNINESSGFCTRYCGWHTAATPSAGHVRYSFVGNAARCINSCAAQSVSPNNNPGVDGMLSVLAHELEEANTDPDPLSGWADSGGGENADKCAWTFGQNQTTLPNGSVYNLTLGTRHFLIQRNLSATNNRCYIDGVLGLQ